MIRTVAQRILSDPDNITASSEAARLNRSGEPSPGDHRAEMYGRRPAGTPWRASTIRDILRSDASLGYLTHQGRANAQEGTFRILEGGRARPSQLRELHFMATVLTFLMAKGSHDMGESKVALQQARVAAFCAKEAEHTGLMAVVDGLKSLISYWAGRPDDALHYARQGATYAPNQRGTVSVWLPGLEARAAALLGDEGAVRAANQRAESLRELVVPDDLDALGGLLTYPELKQLYYVVESEVLLGHGDTQLATRAEEAVRGFSNREQSHWAFGDLAGSQGNLALVRLHAEDLDGAAAGIRPVLDLAPGMRNNGIVRSAERVRDALGRNSMGATPLAGDLRTEIGMFEPSRPALPR